MPIDMPIGLRFIEFHRLLPLKQTESPEHKDQGGDDDHGLDEKSDGRIDTGDTIHKTDSDPRDKQNDDDQDDVVKGCVH
jgi:hypothetical protein